MSSGATSTGGGCASGEVDENPIRKGHGGDQGAEHGSHKQGTAGRGSDSCLEKVQGSRGVTREDIQPIVPMGVLTLMGYEVEWKQDSCRVRRRNRNLEVEMVDSCPMVDAEVALELIDEMELMEEKRAMRLAAMKPVEGSTGAGDDKGSGRILSRSAGGDHESCGTVHGSGR